MKSKKKQLFLFFLFLSFLLSGASFVLGQGNSLEVGQYPDVFGADAPTSVRTPLPDYARYVLNLLLSLAGLVIFAALVYAGYRYLTASGSPIKLETAKKQFWAALLGLIIILSSYLILYTINPQLVIFRMPEWVKVDFPAFVTERPPLEEQTLHAQEIPIGQLIDGQQREFNQETKSYLYEGALAGSRLNRIKNVLEDIKKTAEDLEKKSGELTSLASQCACSQTYPQCVGECAGAVCLGDPCAVRGQIDNKSEEIQKILDGTETATGLKDWQKKLDEEINGQKGLKQALKDLEKAEQTMKRCPSSFSEQGKTQVLLNAADFEAYGSGLEQQKIVKAVEAQPIWENIYAGNEDFTFYCSETPFDVSLEEGGISEESLTEEIATIRTAETEENRVFCETEIPVGETIDDAESLTKKIIAELENINKNLLAEMASAKKIIEFANPESCVVGSCTPEFDCYIEIIPVPCPEPEEEEAPPGEEEPWLGIPSVYAQGCTEEVCISPSECLGSHCPGDQPKMSQISSQFSGIQNNFAEISLSYETIKAATEQDKLEEVPTLKTVSGKLRDTRTKLGDPVRGCFNTAGDWTRAVFGEKILEKQFLTCEEAKSVCWDFEEDYVCYGEGNPEAYINYFCGEVKSP